jgi:hypothetical protein
MAGLDTHVSNSNSNSINSPIAHADTEIHVYPLSLQITDSEVWKLKQFTVQIAAPNNDATSPTIIGFDRNTYTIVYEKNSIFT